jgi:UDP-N-acetylmuramoyl-L-alanyl-D-glutamate--2,6-diaminopimelate ligase
VVDYAHTPDALEKVLHSLRDVLTADQHGGRLWCVFGCGGDRDRGKRPLMGEIAQRLADRVIITDDNPRSEAGDTIVADIMAGIAARAEVQVQRDRGRAIATAINQAGAGDIVLIAGKGHEDYQQIGERRWPFDDREQARVYLAARRGGVAQ